MNYVHFDCRFNPPRFTGQIHFMGMPHEHPHHPAHPEHPDHHRFPKGTFVDEPRKPEVKGTFVEPPAPEQKKPE